MFGREERATEARDGFEVPFRSESVDPWPPPGEGVGENVCADGVPMGLKRLDQFLMQTRTAGQLSGGHAECILGTRGSHQCQAYVVRRLKQPRERSPGDFSRCPALVAHAARS